MLRIRGWLLGLALAAGMASPAAAAEWLRAESPHFVVYGESGERRLREYDLMLEDFDGLLRSILMPGAKGIPGPKLTVFLVDDHKKLELVYPGADAQIAGFYASSTDQIFAVAIRSGAFEEDRTRGDDTVLHEYTHHFFAQNFPGGYPAWLQEGYAEYFATAGLSDKIKVGDWNTGRAYTLVQDRWLPTTDLIGKSVSETPPDRRLAYYAEAWLLTHYMLSEPNRAKALAGYLKGLEKGADPTASWVDVFGDTKGLDKALHDYMSKPMRGSLWTRSWATPQVAVTPVPAPAASVLLARRALHRGLKADAAERPRKAIEEAAAKYPDDATVMTVKAIADSEFGDRAAANALLDKLIAKDPRNEEALRQRAINHIDLAEDAKTTSEQRETELREASRLLGLASKVNPDSYQTLYWYARSRQAEPDFPSQNTYNVMLKAADLAPQVTELRVSAAQLAMRRNDVAVAREMLTPVASDPHGADTAKYARKMLEELAAEPATKSAAAKAPEESASPARPGS